MNDRYHTYEPYKGHSLRFNPIGTIIGPRVIGWIGSHSTDGRKNLAPYSFFNLFNYTPPILGFASIGYKDSIKNILETKTFTWNLVTKDVLEKMNLSSIEKDVDEFEYSSLTAVKGSLIDSPYVEESLVSIECRYTQSHRLKTSDDINLDTWIVFGEAVLVRIDKKLIKDNTFSSDNLDLILRGGGPSSYYSINNESELQLKRPKNI